MVEVSCCIAIRNKNVYCGAAASPPADDPRFHGDSIVAARPLLGDAVKIGSTPLNKVIAVGEDVAEPSVATIITAAPLCRSARVTAGSRLNICWKSGGPPERIAPPPQFPP